MSESDLRRFWAKVQPEPMSGCWLFVGAWNDRGYGQLWVAGRLRYAHRVAYEHWRGPIPRDRQPDHLCRVRCCANPWHMESVTPRENYLRGVGFAAVNAVKTHCPAGHEYTPANTRIGARTGYRFCRACAVTDNRLYRERRRAQKV